MNDMSQTRKMQEIEAALGGPVKAARAAGVSYVSWWRWSTGKVSPWNPELINLLWEKHCGQRKRGRSA